MTDFSRARRGLVAGVAAAALFTALSCSKESFIRKETLQVSVAWKGAKTLSTSELEERFARIFAQREILAVKGAFTFSAESVAQMKREKLPALPGVLILAPGGNLRLQLEAPVIRTNALDLVAKDGEFRLWYPDRKTLYVGMVDQDLSDVTLASSDNAKAPRYNLSRLRPWHLTQAFYHSRLDPSSTLAFVQEDTSMERCYVLHEVGKGPSGHAEILQKIWLERSTLSVRRKTIYSSGAPMCTVDYSRFSTAEEGGFPRLVTISRPMEGFQVQVEIKSQRPMAQARPEAFELEVPEGAKIERIQASEKK